MISSYFAGENNNQISSATHAFLKFLNLVLSCSEKHCSESPLILHVSLQESNEPKIHGATPGVMETIGIYILVKTTFLCTKCKRFMDNFLWAILMP